MSPSYHHGIVAEIDPVTLYRILWLRVGAFVVEQETLRILRDSENLHIGGVATTTTPTHPEARSTGRCPLSGFGGSPRQGPPDPPAAAAGGFGCWLSIRLAGLHRQARSRWHRPSIGSIGDA
ncbi:hypothetical protein [Demequina sp.]|uniref:hypothetical protein n=1 Tax=Demequina sp. TaxID=2050685 RepID=UPI0025C111D3|nr:hypothetical protein [Demequina sp.]